MKAWKIDRDTALRKIRATSQRYKRKLDPSMKRNITTGDRQLRYNRINDHLFMDTMFAMANGGKSIRGNTCAQIFTTDKGFIGVYPMKSKGEAKLALRLFCKEVGVPTAFVCDQSGEQTSKEIKEYIGNVGSSLRLLEAGTPWANRAELVIGHLKARVRSTMKDANCSPMFWDYCMEWVARVNNLTAKNLYQLRGQTPHTTVFGEEGAISVLGDFTCYEVVYYWSIPASRK